MRWTRLTPFPGRCQLWLIHFLQCSLPGGGLMFGRLWRHSVTGTLVDIKAVPPGRLDGGMAASGACAVRYGGALGVWRSWCIPDGHCGWRLTTTQRTALFCHCLNMARTDYSPARCLLLPVVRLSATFSGLWACRRSAVAVCGVTGNCLWLFSAGVGEFPAQAFPVSGLGRLPHDLG